MGPLVAQRQVDLLNEQISDAVEKGAIVHKGSNIPTNLSGAYIQPTILVGVTQEMRAYHEELFGPVLVIHSFTDESDVIHLANDSIYGLSAYVYTKNIEKGVSIAQKLNAGNVSINGESYLTSSAFFGGRKHSGIGGNDGKYGFDYVTRKKMIAIPSKN